MKKFIAFAALVLCLCSCLVGCAPNDISKEPNNGSSMFVMIEETSTWKVVYHKDTRVMYAVSDGRYNYGNFTLLVNPDGSPMVYGGK